MSQFAGKTIGVLTLVVWSCYAQTGCSQEGAERARRVFQPRDVLRSPVRPLVSVPTLKAESVTDQVNANELVLGVEVNGQARAYPINMLTGPQREIVNDTVAGRAIAATW